MTSSCKGSKISQGSAEHSKEAGGHVTAHPGAFSQWAGWQCLTLPKPHTLHLRTIAPVVSKTHVWVMS